MGANPEESRLQLHARNQVLNADISRTGSRIRYVTCKVFDCAISGIGSLSLHDIEHLSCHDLFPFFPIITYSNGTHR